MGRLIEVQDAPGCPSSLACQTGDVLLFHATGGRVLSTGEVIEMWGPLLTAVMGSNGAILAPEGAPNVVLFRACRAGLATIDVITGAPWQATQTTKLVVNVEP